MITRKKQEACFDANDTKQASYKYRHNYIKNTGTELTKREINDIRKIIEILGVGRCECGEILSDSRYCPSCNEEKVYRLPTVIFLVNNVLTLTDELKKLKTRVTNLEDY